jgi:hypothetical protein
MSKNASALTLLRKMLDNPSKIDGLRKAWTQPASSTTGIQNYNLEAPSKKYIPVYTPFRNKLARYKVTGGNAINWRAVTAINTTNISPGVSEGNRNAFLNSTTKDYTRKFAGIGHEDYVTFEADYSAEGFEDLRAMCLENTLDACYISEEFTILGGHGSGAYNLAAPTVLTIADAGAVAGATTTTRANVYFCVVPLTVEGMRFVGYTGPVSDGSVQIVDQTIRTNADSSVDTVNGGHGPYSAISASAGITAAHGVNLACKAVRGAYGYAWFTGAANAYASLKLAYVSNINKVQLTADENAAAQVATTMVNDRSNNGLLFDGLLSMIADSTSGGVWTSLDGANMSANQDGSINEIDAVLQTMWNTSRTTVDELWCNIQEIINIGKKALASGTSTAFRITVDPSSDLNGLQVGSIVGTYLSKFTYDGGKAIPVRLHPNIPAGTILGMSNTLPYKSNNVPAVARMAVRKEYYGQDWPLKSRKYEHGVYVDELLQLYAAFACFVLTNIGNG